MRYFVILMAVFLLNGFSARALSPTERFQNDVFIKYRDAYPRKDLDLFLKGLPWSLEQRQRAIDVFEGDAIRMAAIFGDYSGILQLPDKELEKLGRDMLEFLAKDFQAFWLKLTPRTREYLYQNPSDIRRIIDILKGFRESSETDDYKRIIFSCPDSLVFLHRLPSLLKVPEDRLPVFLHFLQNIDFSEENQDSVEGLDDFIANWHRQLFHLYIANCEKHGASTGLAMWAAPDFFRNNSPKLSDDLEWNERMWPVLVGQISFIRHIQENSLHWPTDAEDIVKLINRDPLSDALDNIDWLNFLLRMGQTDGDVMKLLWDMRNDSTKLRRVDEFLAFLKDEEVPFSVMLNLIKLSRTSDDLLFLMEHCQDPLYRPDPLQETAENYIPLPIVQMSELISNGDYVNMLSFHKHKLTTYLKDRKRGKTIQARFERALKFKLTDVEYDQSTIRTACRWVPGGNLANVVIKSYSGYPVTGLEYTLAVVDVGRAAVALATLGGSEAATQAATKTAEKTVETAVTSVAEKAGEKTLETALDTARDMIIENVVEKYTDDVVGGALEELAERIQDKYHRKKSEEEMEEAKRRIWEDSRTSNAFNLQSDNLIAKRFGFLPLRHVANRQRTFSTGSGFVKRVRLPETNKKWLSALQGKETLNSILLVTLGDIK